MAKSATKTSAPPIAGKSSDLQFHPLANLFPLLGEEELATLAQDIADNGLQFSITMFEGKILDGRNRYTACVMSNTVPRFVDYEGDDPVGFVVSTNLHRRHLTTGQRAMIAEKLATQPEGRPPKTPANAVVSQESASKLLNVSEDSIQRARKVRNDAVPEIVAAVESGKLPVSVAATLADAPPDKQREVIAKNDKKAILAASKEIRKEMAEERREKRTQQIVEATCNNKPLDGSLGKFAVIYADPPWAYDSSESDTRVIENHYPTMSLDDIRALDVPSVAHDDAILFLWTTSPKLQDAFDVLKSWGFDYRTCAVWDKEKIGMGYYFRQQHEILLGQIYLPGPERPLSAFF